MEERNVADNTIGHLNIAEDDSTIYLFGSELYCGWCLESFTCPVRLKIHCHIEHLSTCSCGEEFPDKEALCEHVAYAGCVLPPPFHWSHFMKLPPTELLDADCTEAWEDTIEHCSLDDTGSTDEKTSSRSAKKFSDNIKVTDADENEKMSMKRKRNKKPGMRSLKQRVYSCGFCPYQSTKSLTYRCHMRRHRKKKSMPWKSCVEGSKRMEDCVTIEDDTADTQDAKRYLDSLQHPCCEKHRTDDVGFIVSCFSSPADGKPLCCALCSEEVIDWEEATMHVYSKHLSDFKRWRATQSRCKSENDHVNKSAVDDPLETCSTAVLCDNPTSDSGACSGSLHLNVSEQFSTSVEYNSVEETSSQLPENRTKCVLTTDECKLLVSSLCQLLSCWNNNEREQATPVGDTLDVDRTTAESDASAHNSAKQLSAATDSAESTKPAERVTSRKCKFCQRVFLKRPNCQRHEAVCGRVLKCKFCQKQFIKIYEHRRHEGICRGASRCKFCQQVLSNRFNCRKHEAVCSRQKRFTKGCERLQHEGICSGASKCKLCQRVFNNWMNCQRHEATCGQVNKCKHCGKEFSWSSRCRRHEATCHLISRCKFCPKRFFSEAKRQRHEGMCKHSMSDSKSVVQSQKSPSGNLPEDSADTVWKIRGSRIYYCSRCGFSASDRRQIEMHLMHPHVINARNRLVVKVQPRHDYIGSMRVSVGHYQCSLCGEHRVSRSRMLLHLRKHSSAVTTSSARPSSSLKKPEDIAKEQSGTKYPSATHARSCQKCSRSFSSVAKFLCHRAVCQAVRSREMLDRRQNKRSYLYEFCEQADNGRWLCKLCSHSKIHRHAVYTHIRRKHEHVVNRKLEAERKSVMEISRVLTERMENGQRRCKLCNFVSTAHLLRHIRNKHADKLNKTTDVTCAKSCTKCCRSFNSAAEFLSHRAMCRAIESQQEVNRGGKKRSYLSDFCQKTSNGRWQCKLCDEDMAYRRLVYRHIQEKHKPVVKTKLETDDKQFPEIGQALVEKTEDGRWRCMICNVISADSLLQHVRVSHSDKLFCSVNVDGRFQCTLCNHSRQRRANLYAHIRSAHCKELLSTELSAASLSVSSGEVSSTAGKYAAQANSVKKPHFMKPCPKCGTVFAHKLAYVNHVKWCGTGSNTTVLKSVKKSEKHFVRPCPKCGKVFVRKSSHTNHLNWCVAANNTTSVVLKSAKMSENHSEKTCPKCGQIFTCGPAYSSHLRWCDRLMHLNRFVEPVSSGWMRCGLCSMTYSSRSKCLVHIGRQHPLSCALTNTKSDHMPGYIKTEPADDLMSADNDNEPCSGDGVIDETVCKVENSP